MDPRTGEVLAMVSHPTFDPNAFAVRIGRNEWNGLINDPNHPLLNKAIQAQLAPGSTFKILMATAGLQEGVAQDLQVFCTGRRVRSMAATSSAGCRMADTANVGITKGIYQSCDVFFYTLAEQLGIDKIAKWAHAWGWARGRASICRTKSSGTMPSQEWKMKNFHQKWYAGEVISVGIGQGAVAATPVQMARAFAGIASGGVLKRPHVVFPEEVAARVPPGAARNNAGFGRRERAARSRRTGRSSPMPWRR